MPIQIVNDGQLPLNGISLAIKITKDGDVSEDVAVSELATSLSEYMISNLSFRQSKNLTLTLSVNSEKDADYVIEISANVNNPVYQDSAKFYLSVSKNKELKDKFVFTESLMLSNSECAELRENYNEAQKLYDDDKVEEAKAKLLEIDNACRVLISEEPSRIDFGTGWNKAIGYIAVGLFGIFIIGFVFYLVRHRRIRKGISQR